MGRTWIIESERKVEEEFIELDMETIFKHYHCKLTEYPENPLEPIQKIWTDDMKELFRTLSLEMERVNKGKRVDLNATDWILYPVLQAIKKAMEGK